MAFTGLERMVTKHLDFAALVRHACVYPYDQAWNLGAYTAANTDFYVFVQVTDAPVIGDPSDLGIRDPLPPGDLQLVNYGYLWNRIPFGRTSVL